MQIDLNKIFFELKDKMLIFQFFNSEELGMILPYFEIGIYPQGTTIFNEGDKADYIGFVISGRLEVKKQTEFKGKNVVLAILSRGSIAGEFSMVDAQPRTATITTLEDTRLLILTRDTLEMFIRRHPDSGIKLLKGIIRTMAIRMNSFAERLVKFF